MAAVIQEDELNGLTSPFSPFIQLPMKIARLAYFVRQRPATAAPR